MFTGLVTDVGHVLDAVSTDAGLELRIATTFTELTDGESIAVNGVCLTVRASGTYSGSDDTASHTVGTNAGTNAATPLHGNWFTCAAVHTTIAKTTIGQIALGDAVNLERALLVGDRLGGHIVQGHVDGTGQVSSVVTSGDALLIDVVLPDELNALMAPQGSITVNGVSLTVNALLPSGVQLSIIEFTRKHTNLGALKEGDAVNIEADVLAKHLQRLIAPYISTLGIPTI